MTKPESTSTSSRPRVFHWRKSRGLSVREAALEIGIDYSVLSRIERCVRPARYDHAEKIAAVTGQSPSQVIEESVHIIRSRRDGR